MQSYEDAPPPYPGTTSHTTPNILTSKGDYKSVPVYEIGPNNVHVYGPTAYQQIPSMATGPTIVQTSPIQVGHRAVHCICPRCHQQIVTRVDYESGSFAWLMCLLLTVVGCVPCCIIPFCATSCQDITHTCPHCSSVVGRRKVL